MPSPEFVKIASWHNPADAEHAKAVLNWNGIDAFIEGADLKTSLSYIGSALGDVKLIVRSEDSQRAQRLLDELSREARDPINGPWFCGECEEVIEPGFDMCWSCGQPREEVEAPFPEVADLATESEGSDPRDPANASLPESASVDATNPYAPPTVQAMFEKIEAEDEPTSQEEAEDLITQSANAAVLGILIPLFGTLYSLFLLFAALRLSWNFSSRTRYLIFQSLAVNFVVSSIWLALLWLFSLM